MHVCVCMCVQDDSGDDSSVSAADWKGAREQVFPDGGPNEFRHLRLADFTDNVSALPRYVCVNGTHVSVLPRCMCGPVWAHVG